MHLVKFQVPPGFNPSAADERNFYFAVEDWYIRGSCYCYGQSAECNTEVIGIKGRVVTNGLQQEGSEFYCYHIKEAC